MDKAEADAQAAIKRGQYEHSSVLLYEEELLKAPSLPRHCEFYWTAFQAINSMRPVGMAAGKLRWDDTMKLADHYGLTFQEKENLWFIIRSMDAVVLSESDKKSSGPAK
ncbi:phage tail assembly chaperone [Sphingomonas sp. M1A8_2b]